MENDELEKVKEYGEYTENVGARDKIEGNGLWFGFTYLYQQDAFSASMLILKVYVFVI